MNKSAKNQLAHVIGPLGERLTIDCLPPRDMNHWVIRRKAEVVAAVNGGLLTFEEACDRYDLSLEELASWQRAVARFGMHGLRVTRSQHYKAALKRGTQDGPHSPRDASMVSSAEGEAGSKPELVRFDGGRRDLLQGP